VAGSIGVKSAGRLPTTQHLPGLDRCVEPFQRHSAKIRNIEPIADKTFRRWVDDQLIGLCQRLKAGSEIRSFPKHRPFLRSILSHEFADDDWTSRNADSRSNFKLWMGSILIQRLYRIQNSQPGIDRPFRIVFMGIGISKVDQQPIAHVFGDIAIEPTNRLGTSVEKTSGHVLEVFRIHPARQGGRIHQITKHHRQLTTFGLISFGREWRRARTDGVGERSRARQVSARRQLRNRAQENFPMSQ
jgi:hypothetical protein